jgi:thioredoxin-dependent peroxiredoxin
MRQARFSWSGVLLLVLLVAGVARADEGLLPVGAVAPEVEGKDASGAVVKLSASLSAAKGRSAIVYFYPKDETPGCTKEACAFRDAYDKFVKAGVTIFAVSRDTEASHKGFREHFKLPFPMVADPSGAVQKAYRVPGDVVAKRVSFLVGPDGKIARVWPSVDPVVHAGEVLEAAAALKKPAKP